MGSGAATDGIDLERYIADVEKSLLQSALRRSNGIQTRAGRAAAPQLPQLPPHDEEVRPFVESAGRLYTEFMWYILRFIWNATRGHRLAPWRSPYIKWRLETYTGLKMEKIGLWQIVNIMLQNIGRCGASCCGRPRWTTTRG